MISLFKQSEPRSSRLNLAWCFMILVVFSSVALLPGRASALIVDHTATGDFGKIPSSYFSICRDRQKIYYGHTSHGSQLITGMEMLEETDDSSNPGLYDRPDIHEDSPDLGYPEWEPNTRAYLNAHPDTTLVMWSWCGQLSDMASPEVDDYLSKMDKLESDYPDTTFVYMTGHLDGTGTNGTLNKNNERIRDYCKDHSKVLYDFADIESYDPGGKFYPNASDVCEWCENWCDTYSCPDCADCAHSHCFNCYLKGQALWWMLARVAGWSGEGDNSNGPHDFYVQQSGGNDANPGNAWGIGHAFATIGKAMAIAAGSAGSDTIHVAAGDYRETVNMVSNVTILGGYPVSGGTQQIKWSGTIINGENKRPGVLIVDCRDVVVDGFVIQNGSVTTSGAGINIDDSSEVAISDNIIVGNSAGLDGGGIYFKASDGRIERNIIDGNSCGNKGGGICIYGSSGPVINNLIINNVAATGGGISYSDQSSASLINNTIADNSAHSSGGVGCHDGSTSDIINCIVWGNTPGQIAKSADSTLTATFSDIENGYAGTGNIDSDPRFTGNGGYALVQGSPCIDKGTMTSAPLIDLAGYPRPYGKSVDMGAYEFKITGPTVVSASPESGALHVDPGTLIVATFSDDMAASSINSQTFIVKDTAGSKVSGSIAYAGKSAAFTPAAALAPGEKYTVTLTTGIKSTGGVALTGDYVWEFTTNEESGSGGCFIGLLLLNW
ncbi:MAG: Ig-like domain-containing protein [Desulfosalsimonadaceae bacterium]|nr:Ig-like domain-containing protein [Desulfosalsimonadaceae bacterium]